MLEPYMTAGRGLEGSGSGPEFSSAARRAATTALAQEKSPMRHLINQWIGPFGYRDAFYVVKTGLYLVYVGQTPIYLAAGVDLSRAMSEHLIFRDRRVAPADMTGREMMDYSRRYNIRLTAKLARVRELEGDPVEDLETLNDIVSLLVSQSRFPCNIYGREQYDGAQQLRVENHGKYHPLGQVYEVAENDAPSQ